MNKVIIKPGALNGTVSVPPSKSAAHRAIICAALSDGTSIIEPVELSNDIKATIECMKKLGAEIQLENKTLTVNGRNIFSADNIQLDCGESGSTLRFLIPVAAAGGVSTEFVGHGKLPERPIGVFTECLPQHNVECITKGGLPLKINGRLESGTYYVPGNISSQFITGLLLALPLTNGNSEIILTSELQSGDYINMTVDTMKAFGVEVSASENGWKIKGGQHYKPMHFTVEGDWSQAAFFMTAAALGGKITIDNLDINSRQGDKACMEIYSRFGADITMHDNGCITIEHNKLKGTEINAENIPDMVPALAVVAALCKGTTVITGAERLRIKECDRLAAMRDGLSRLGADITETPDGFIINGREKLFGAEVDGYNDHRIVMSLTVAAVRSDGDI
ncbi:MAG: 3-phosphoshikimate 1-carboxyvinyltransferase, partial [Clostridia bacterium]|nr:3-phosphoshikimate 1-carboxyvinyltransferase [Clostridia bacterium]